MDKIAEAGLTLVDLDVMKREEFRSYREFRSCL